MTAEEGANGRNGPMCCKRFNSQAWDGRVIYMDNKLFLRLKTRSEHYRPINRVAVLQEARAAITAAGAATHHLPMILSEDLGPTAAVHLYEVAEPVPEHDMVRVSGSFRTKAVEGAYENLPNWLAAFRGELTVQGFNPGHIYAWFTTCPSCAAVYGENPVVLVAAKLGATINPA